MSLRWVAAIAVLSGCDSVLGLEREELDCGSYATLIDDEFDGDGSMPCESWGIGFENPGTSLVQNNGELQVTPRATNAAGCTSKVMYRFPRGGLIVEVSEALRVEGAYTEVNASEDDTIQVVSNTLVYGSSDGQTRYGEVPYDPTTMRWWKLQDEVGTLAASYSADGVSSWVMFGQRSATVSAKNKIELVAGLYADVPGGATGAVRFGRLLVCD